MSMTAACGTKMEKKPMTIYTLESETGNITAFPTAEAAAAGSETPFDIFSNQQELAELVAHWPPERLFAAYNSLPGVKVST